MPLSRNQSKSAENLRCQRNLFDVHPTHTQCAQILENYYQIRRYKYTQDVLSLLICHTSTLSALQAPPTTAASLTLVCISYRLKEQ